MKREFNEVLKAVIIGHAVADALGVPVEFKDRKYLSLHPITDMVGYGTYNMPKGTWSDDTSMAICSLSALNNGKINFDKIMNNFCLWYNSGQFTPTGVTFDVGGTCSMAIENYYNNYKSWKECGISTEKSNGNGSLMRIYPFVFYTYKLQTDLKTKIDIIELASGLTHAHKRSKIACGIYAFILWELIDNPCKNSVYVGLKKAKEYYLNELESAYFYRVFADNFASLSPNLINSSGYVVDSLEASIWCLLNSTNYKTCVLKAVNLGDDTDSVGAIAGSLAGALYGYNDIPLEWKQSLIKRDYLESFSNNL